MHEKINYLEISVQNMAASKIFFQSVFNWKFTDYGEGYSAFHHAGIDGGFAQSEQPTQSSCVLVVFYSADLEATQTKITEAGGTIVQETFDFPGGRRFHFTDPSGNEFAVWSDQE